MDLLQEARAIINDVDSQMAGLFARRMQAARMVAQYKQAHGLPILDAQREEAVIRNGCARVEEALQPYYTDFMRATMAISRQYQQQLLQRDADLLAEFHITIRRGALSEAGRYFKLDRKVLIVTDSGVPARYAQAVAACCAEPFTVTVPRGEGSKSFAGLELLLRAMLENGFTRTDCVVAVGGGVVGDLAGFASATYMRGIDFYNIPTTLLSQVDSSVGGKVAIDLDGIKNCVGAFHQPKAVLIDPEVLSTLPPRQVSNGLAEAVKMAVLFDDSLLRLFEQEDCISHIDRIITRCLQLKAAIVQADEKEAGLRRVLNFGHTIGHGIESATGPDGLYHGECIALGMLPMCGDALRPRVQAIMEKLGLPTACEADPEAVWAAMTHDKKLSGDTVTVVFAPKAGSFVLRAMPLADLKETVRAFLSRKE